MTSFCAPQDPASVSRKMANTLSASNRLHKTYNPVNVVAVREVDAARTVGRKRLRTKNKPDEKCTSTPISVTDPKR
jgi:hypothetical protein